MSLIILDRDGVINQFAGEAIQSPADWLPIEGSLEAIAKLNQANYRVIVITNQPSIGQNEFDVEMLTKIHSKMRRMLSQVGGKIEAVLYCSHRADQACACWEPLSSPFEELSQRLRIDLTRVPVVSPNLIHLNAAKALGAKPILVTNANAEQGFEAGFHDLASIADALLSESLQ